MNKEWHSSQGPENRDHWQAAWWLQDEDESPEKITYVYVVLGADSLYYVRQWPTSTETFTPKNIAGPFNDLKPAQAAYRILT